MPRDETRLGSADIQSLADLPASCRIVRMPPVPLGTHVVICAPAITTPILPVAFAVFLLPGLLARLDWILL